MLTPSQHQSSQMGYQDQIQSSTQGLTALTQNVISGKAAHMIGARIIPVPALGPPGLHQEGPLDQQQCICCDRGKAGSKW